MQRLGTHRQTWLRSVAVMVVLCTIAAACGGGGGSSSSNQSSGSSTGGSDSTDVEQALVNAGVRVLSDDGASTVIEPAAPESAMTVRVGWAKAMAAEAADGAGHLGADLDVLGGGAPDGIPPSAVLAAYVLGVDTDGARTSKRLLEDQDVTHPQEVVFPSAVLALFAADASRAFSPEGVTESTGTSAGTAPPGEPVALGPEQLQLIAGGPCSDVSGAIFKTIDKVFAAIHISPVNMPKTGIAFLDGIVQGLTNVVVAGINIVLDAARTLIVNGVKFILDKVLSVVAQIATLASLVANFISAVRPFNLVARPDADNVTKDVNPVRDEVLVKANLVGGSDDWPEWFADCAAVAGVPLPSLRPLGATVEWTTTQSPPDADLVRETSKKERTLAPGTGGHPQAILGLDIGTETKEQAQGEAQLGRAVVTARVRRAEIEQLRDTLTKAVVQQAARALVIVPSFIANWVTNIVSQAVKDASGDLASLIDGTAKTKIDVTYHGPPDKKKQPVPTVSGDVWSLAIFQEGATAPGWVGYTCSGLLGTWHALFLVVPSDIASAANAFTLAFNGGSTAHHDSIYDFPPSGTSPAVHVEWRIDYTISSNDKGPTMALTGTQYEAAEGREYTFPITPGFGGPGAGPDGARQLEPQSINELLAGRGFEHPFLTQAKAECGR